MKYLPVIGRVLFALPFGLLGLNHFFMYDYYLGIVSSFIPGGGFTVIIVGIALIAASVSIISRRFIRLSCLLLALLLLIFIATIHIPGLFSPDKNMVTVSLIELLKDTALLGGSLMIAGYNRLMEKPEVKEQPVQ
jgi:putative oxidoreductase